MPDYYSTYTGQQIDASVGEVVNAGGAVSARLVGNGEPTSSTAARVGDLYTDISTGGKMYRCIRVNGSTYTWDVVGSGDGVSPQAEVERVEGGAIIKITDERGTTTADIYDGVSPSASVEQTDDGAVITVVDEEGTTTATLNNGVSPEVTVARVSDEVRITITDADGTTTATVSDGFSPIISTVPETGGNLLYIVTESSTKQVHIKDGYHIGDVRRTSGSTLPGQTATYTMYLNDEDETEVGTFDVYNGADGEGVGDMTKAVYDTNNNGIVDNAEKLGGNLPEYYAASDDIPTKVSDLTNDSGFVTNNDIANKADLVNGKIPSSQLPDIPIASASVIGGIKAQTKQSGDTQPVRIDADGNLWTAQGGSGTGDMLKSVYDTNDNGVVDNAEKLDGHAASYFATAASVPTKTSDLTNDSGFITDEDIPEPYTLPIASSSALGGIKADAKQSGDTQAVRIDANGKLWTAPGGGGSAFVPYNVNLLDNADWFAYVINQRGSTTYRQGGQYGFDRWQIYNAATIVDGAVQMGAHCTLRQLIEIPRNVLIDRDYTVAIDINETVYSEHINLTSAGVSTSIGGVDVTFGFFSGEYVICGKTETYCPYIAFNNNSETVINVRRVWLELGSVCHMETTPPKSYAENLAVCQRYFVRYELQLAGIFGQVSGATSTSDVTFVYVSIPSKTIMRVTNPTLTHTRRSAASYDYVNGTGTNASTNSYRSGAYADGYGLKFIADLVAPTTIGKGIALYCQAGDIFNFSADL